MIPLDATELNDPTLPWHVTVLDEVGSTSDWLKQRAAELPVGSVVFTESKPQAVVVATTAGSPREARI
jgi:hypothetical protein